MLLDMMIMDWMFYEVREELQVTQLYNTLIKCTSKCTIMLWNHTRAAWLMLQGSAILMAQLVFLTRTKYLVPLNTKISRWMELLGLI